MAYKLRHLDSLGFLPTLFRRENLEKQINHFAAVDFTTDDQEFAYDYKKQKEWLDTIPSSFLQPVMNHLKFDLYSRESWDSTHKGAINKAITLVKD